MGICDGKVVVVTGGGRGLGREHALGFAREGGRVVVNDLAGEENPAQQVVDEIIAAGGEAKANTDDVSDWDGAGRLIEQAIEEFGQLDVLVNNAGILRDRMLSNMSVDEWDAVMKVHLRGTFCPTRHAVEHWRARSKAGEAVQAAVINTSSPSGLYGNVGQSNYGAAKAAIAAFTVIAADELGRYGVTVNAIAPSALTRMTQGLDAYVAALEERKARTGFDAGSPAHIAPLVVYLGSSLARGITGRVFNVRGGHISVAETWEAGPGIDEERHFDPLELADIVPALIEKARPNSDGRGHPRE